MIIVEVIPYLTFKQRIKLTKELHKCKVFIYPTYLYIERVAMQ